MRYIFRITTSEWWIIGVCHLSSLCYCAKPIRTFLNTLSSLSKTKTKKKTKKCYVSQTKRKRLLFSYLHEKNGFCSRQCVFLVKFCHLLDIGRTTSLWLRHTAETLLRDVMTLRHSTRRSAVRDVEPTASLTFWIKMSVFHDEIEIEDFEYDEDTETYYFPCPCGDKFAITKVRPALRQLVAVS